PGSTTKPVTSRMDLMFMPPPAHGWQLSSRAGGVRLLLLGRGLLLGLFPGFLLRSALGRRLRLAGAPQVSGVGALVGLDVAERAVGIADGVELGSLRAAQGCPFHLAFLLCGH